MNLINRNSDIVSNNNDLEHLHTFKNFPAFMGCVEQPREQDIVSNMNWYISKSSGMVQLDPLLPLEVVYQTEHNPGTTGQGWNNHHRAFAEFLSKHSPKSVFEIGGAHGILSEYCREIYSDIDWTILEPNPIPVEGLKAKVRKGFFTEDTVLPSNVDMIVHSHVLEHVYNPTKFFEGLANIKEGTYHCFSVPALKKHMEQIFTNVLNFEHTYFCIEEFIEWWLECYGFEILEKKYYETDHSIFYASRRTNREVSITSHPNLYAENKDLINKYIRYHKQLVDGFIMKINDRNDHIYLFGAHVFSQFLLSFGLDETKFKCILDNSAAKENKRLYGTGLTVCNPRVLKGIDSPIVVLRSGVFNEEIKEDILTNINPTTIFLE